MQGLHFKLWCLQFWDIFVSWVSLRCWAMPRKGRGKQSHTSQHWFYVSLWFSVSVPGGGSPAQLIFSFWILDASNSIWMLSTFILSLLIPFFFFLKLNFSLLFPSTAFVLLFSCASACHDERKTILAALKKFSNSIVRSRFWLLWDHLHLCCPGFPPIPACLQMLIPAASIHSFHPRKLIRNLVLPKSDSFPCKLWFIMIIFEMLAFFIFNSRLERNGI